MGPHPTAAPGGVASLRTPRSAATPRLWRLSDPGGTGSDRGCRQRSGCASQCGPSGWNRVATKNE